MNFREVAVRAGKTFIQSFLGVLIPELCLVLSSAVPDATFWTVSIPPLLCAALAAGISAAWNIVAAALSPQQVAPELARSDVSFSVVEPFDDDLDYEALADEALDYFLVIKANFLELEFAMDKVDYEALADEMFSSYALALFNISRSSLRAYEFFSPWLPPSEQ